MIDKPYAPACDRNQKPILKILRESFVNVTTVLEIGSGTGQHAMYFAGNFPQLIWQPSDLKEKLAGIKYWLSEASLCNIKEPLVLDVNNFQSSNILYDAIFTANTFHIMDWNTIRNTILLIGKLLRINGKFIVYGPFKFNGVFTSKSNEQFDLYLKSENKNMGIREFIKLEEMANQEGLVFKHRYNMPANNELLEFVKR